MHGFTFISPFQAFDSIDTFYNVQKIMLAASEGPDQTARMRRLNWALAVRLCPKTRFCLHSAAQLILNAEQLCPVKDFIHDKRLMSK